MCSGGGSIHCGGMWQGACVDVWQGHAWWESMHGRGTCVGVCVAGGMHGRGMCGRGVYMAGGMHGRRCACRLGCAWQERRRLQRTVRIYWNAFLLTDLHEPVLA